MPEAKGSRPTPYEMVFDEAFESEFFVAIRDEAAGHDVATRPREQFQLLAEVARTMRTIAPDDIPADAAEQYRALLYHAFQFWLGGRRVYTLDRAVTRYLVESDLAPGDWSLEVPADSVYLRFPPRLFWSSIEPDGQPEPIDGAFLTSSSSEAGNRLEGLLVLGMHRGRSGFSVVPFDAPAAKDAGKWVSMTVREREPDFGNVLPGGEMTGLYSVLTAGEALKLVARCLWYIDLNPNTVSSDDAAGEMLVGLGASDEGVD